MPTQPRAKPDNLARALYAPPSEPRLRQPKTSDNEKGLTMAEADQIAADLEHSEQIAARDAQIAALQAGAAMAAEDPDIVSVPRGTPGEIQLTAPYGFVDDAGRNRSWPAGMKIASPGEVAMLIARSAPHTVTRA